MKSRLIRLVLGMLAVAGIIWFCIPFGWGVRNIGSFFGLAVCGVLLLGCLFWPAIRKACDSSRGWRMFCRTVGILFGAGMVWCAVLTGLIFFGASAVPPQDATVVVLGSKVSGHVPSADLMARIQAAKDWMTAHPGTACIVSGGQGAGELETEAVVMKRTLVNMGIESSRILMEDRSTTTQENLQNALALIDQKGMSRNLAIVTDEYHQYRAGCIARKLGAQPYSVQAHTPWYIFSACYARELLALTKYLIFS